MYRLLGSRLVLSIRILFVATLVEILEHPLNVMCLCTSVTLLQFIIANLVFMQNSCENINQS